MAGPTPPSVDKTPTPQGAHLRCLGSIPSLAGDRKNLKLFRMARVLGLGET